jgi:hypothetical protein
MDATCEEIRMGAGVDVTCIYIYVNTSWILTFAIHVSIMECSEIERRTIPVEEEVAFPYIIISPQSISIVSIPCTLISPLSTSTTVDRFF